MKYYLITYGCQMNKSDSERIAGVLESAGFEPARKFAEADLILINSCSVRQSAEDRVFGQVKNLSKLKKKNPRLVIGVIGCMPGRDKNGALRKKLSSIDFFFTTKDLPQIIKKMSNRKNYQCDFFSCQPKYTSKFQAYVPIQTGCNRFCAYCVVPFARGVEKNRPLKDILKETRSLARRGCLQITLLGQTINSYTAPDVKYFSKKNPYKNHFAALLWEINQIPGISRIHFAAPHPLFMTDEVINALTLPKQVNYLHLPLQSGDNEILRRMSRGYTSEDYLSIIKKIRIKKPEIALGTDIIVGFPGETKKQFQHTVKLYKKIKFDIAYIAQYSPRSGTAAFNLKDTVSQVEKKRRWQVIQNLMEEITLKKNKEYIGKKVEVLVEKFENGILSGNCRDTKLARFKGPKSFVGKIVEVKIDKAKEWVLDGKISNAKK